MLVARRNNDLMSTMFNELLDWNRWNGLCSTEDHGTTPKMNVSESFSATVPLDLHNGQLRSNETEVVAKVAVEKYTETDVKVPINSPDTHQMRFFPEAMTVKCLVALKDYPSISTEDFRVEVDTAQLHAMMPLLDVSLKSWPQYVQVLSTSPDKVEYLIVQ